MKLFPYMWDDGLLLYDHMTSNLTNRVYFAPHSVLFRVCVFEYRTIKRFLQLDPVPVDEVAVVFSVPETGVALQLSDISFKASHRTTP